MSNQKPKSKGYANLDRLSQKAYDTAFECKIINLLHDMPAQVLKGMIMKSAVEAIALGIYNESILTPNDLPIPEGLTKGVNEAGFAIDLGFDAIGIIIKGTVSKEQYDKWIAEAGSYKACDNPNCYACRSKDNEPSAIQPTVDTVQ